MKLVVTGGSGMLGHDLLRRACREHQVWGSFHAHPVDMPGSSMFPLDLAKEQDLAAKLAVIKPDAIVHTAALTNVDECERQPEMAKRINGQGTKLMAEIAEELNARFVYISTDYVFDGDSGGYREDDAPNPVNRYGESKLQGEEWVRRCCSQALILRTTMFGFKIPPQKGLMEALVEALSSGRPMTRFADQYFTPLYCGQLSELILRLIDLGAAGLFHVGSANKLSRYEFARQVADLFAPGRSEISPVPFRQIDGLAKRPRDTSLSSDRIQEHFSITLPRADAGLALLCREWARDNEKGAVSQ